MKTIFLLFLCALAFAQPAIKKLPNIIYIYADDLGYGDLSCYGATKIITPNIDKLAKQGIQFTNGRSTSATCTPSRYSLMTGEYAWRKQGTNILPGDAPLIIPTDKITLPSLLKKGGYKTAIVGKWHLGLGSQLDKNWNKEIVPGPNEIGFDYSFIFPATADRVPTVFVQNHFVVAQDTLDPIVVDYKKPVGNDPTGKEHPELLKMQASPNQGHNNTVVNGIGRIGYMSGGTQARWVDEELSTTLLFKAKDFIEEHQSKPFFLYYALTEPHVPRMPATMFKGKSGLGYRGDVILQLDWTVGEIMKHLKYLGIDKNTMIIFTSDNGPVLNDGYQDDAVEKLNGHIPAGPLRGGKYSVFEAGSRVPFIIKWPEVIKPNVSDALICQIDMLSSFARLTKQTLTKEQGPDSFDVWAALTGKSKQGRTTCIQQGNGLAIIKDNWKYIEPNKGAKLFTNVNIESGNNTEPQLYDLSKDIGEKNNLALQYPEKVDELSDLLQKIKTDGRSR